MKIPRKKKEDDIFESTKKEIKDERKIPFAVRQEIRRRAETRSGGHGSENKQSTSTGRVLRKTFTKSKYGEKLLGKGNSLLKPNTPTPPRKTTVEEAGVIASTFDTKGDFKTRSKPYMAKNREELKEQTTVAQNEAKFKKNEPTTTDVGNAEFARNKQKQVQYNEDKKKSNYVAGSRTAKSDEQIKQDKLMRAKFIKLAGSEGKGERKFKKHLKKQMKIDVRAGKYKQT